MIGLLFAGRHGDEVVRLGLKGVEAETQAGGFNNPQRDLAACGELLEAVKAALAVPVLSNGNVRSSADVAANLAATGAAGAPVRAAAPAKGGCCAIA